MRADYRRRSAATWAVWGSALAVLTALAAWKFHWLTDDVEPIVMQDERNSAAGDNTGGIFRSSAKGGDSDDPGVFADQLEPVSGLGSEYGFPNRFGQRTPPRRLPTQPWNTPIEPAARTTGRTIDPFVRTADVNTDSSRPDFHGISPGRHNAGIIRTANETPRSVAPSTIPAETLMKIDHRMRAGDTLAAHKELSRIYWQKPQWRDAIRLRIEKTARTIYFSPKPHFLRPHEVQPNEFLSTIARKYNVSYQFLERLNGVQARRIRAGDRLKVIKGPFSAVVDLSDREITIHHRGWFVARYPVGIGRDRSSPIGKFVVEENVTDPKYTGRDEITGRNYTIERGDPRNPVGKYWISIGNAYGIHGTNDPRSIGKAESNGCIRLHNADIAVVFELLREGSEVVIQR